MHCAATASMEKCTRQVARCRFLVRGRAKEGLEEEDDGKKLVNGTERKNDRMNDQTSLKATTSADFCGGTDCGVNGKAAAGSTVGYAIRQRDDKTQKRQEQGQGQADPRDGEERERERRGGKARLEGERTSSK
uniref:Uncharacterized protein n=1 Tax=Peronospora matthiolae TaxID=2874970 RepID=A0AAV1U855_9STRA